MDMYTLCICVCIRPPFGCGAGVEGGDWGGRAHETLDHIYICQCICTMYYVLCTMYYVLCTMYYVIMIFMYIHPHLYFYTS